MRRSGAHHTSVVTEAAATGAGAACELRAAEAAESPQALAARLSRGDLVQLLRSEMPDADVQNVDVDATLSGVEVCIHYHTPGRWYDVRGALHVIRECFEIQDSVDLAIFGVCHGKPRKSRRSRAKQVVAVVAPAGVHNHQAVAVAAYVVDQNRLEEPMLEDG